MQALKEEKSSDKIQTKINRLIGKAINQYHMIEEGDKIMVAVSGGKDSLCMLHFLKDFQQKAPVHFEILAVNVDQKQPGHPEDVLPKLFTEWNVPYEIIEQDTYSVVKEKTPFGKSYCSLCSRMRRGILYDKARKFGCNKLALGHHMDDVLETFLLNTFFSGQISTMPPNYLIEAGDLHVIRPLYQIKESLIAEYVTAQQWPIVPCNLCGSQDNMRRQDMKKLINDFSEKYPEMRESAFKALHNVAPNLLPDEKLRSELIATL